MDEVTLKLDKLQTAVEGCAERLTEIEKTINGETGQPGYVVRIDRLERAMKVLVFVAGATYASTTGVLLKWMIQ